MPLGHRRTARRDNGISSVEYALAVAGVAGVPSIAVMGLGEQLASVFRCMADQLSSPVSTCSTLGSPTGAPGSGTGGSGTGGTSATDPTGAPTSTATSTATTTSPSPVTTTTASAETTPTETTPGQASEEPTTR